MVESHTGVLPAQSALLRHATQLLDTVSHRCGEAQSESTRQSTHWPAFMPLKTQALPPSMAGQAAVAEHGPHLKVEVLQTGFPPLHCALSVHPTHVPVATSQTASGLVHCVCCVAEHWPQAPLGWQAGVAPEQSASLAHARHEPPSQVGVRPPQSAEVVHWTQALSLAQRGVPPSARHVPQAIVPPQPLEIDPQASPVGQLVSGTHSQMSSFAAVDDCSHVSVPQAAEETEVHCAQSPNSTLLLVVSQTAVAPLQATPSSPQEHLRQPPSVVPQSGFTVPELWHWLAALLQTF